MDLGRSVNERLHAAGLPPLTRMAWLEIDADALLANLTSIRELAGPAVEVAPVVKADAYGHGLGGVLDAIGTAAGTRLVSRRWTRRWPSEPRRRRCGSCALPRAGIGRGEAVEARLELVAPEEADTMRLLAAWRRSRQGGARRTACCRSTWRSRRACSGAASVPDRAASLAASDAATPRGSPGPVVASRPAGGPPRDRRPGPPVRSCFGRHRRAGSAVPPRHLGATGGVFAGWPGVRDGPPGVGAVRRACRGDRGAGGRGRGEPATGDDAEDTAGPDRRGTGRVRRWGTAAAGSSERPSVIATLPVGYGDGWARASSPGSRALVRGRSVDLVGSVAMDALAADVTDVPGVSETDEFVLLGAQGGERITAGELARRRTTISWEVLTGMAQRLPRVYHRGPDIVALRTSGAKTVHRARGHAS